MYISDPKERIRWVIDKYYKGHPKKLADRINMSPGTFTYILKHGREPSWKLMACILKLHPEVNPDWLMFDSGEKLREIKGKELSKAQIRKFLREMTDVLDE